MDILIQVINEKKEKFQLKTLTYIIWSFSKIDFNSNSVLQLLKELR